MPKMNVPKMNVFMMILTGLTSLLCLSGVYFSIIVDSYFLASVNLILAIVNGFLCYINYLNYGYYRHQTKWWDQVKEQQWHKLENQ